MIFSGVARSSFEAHFDPFLLAAILIPTLLVFLIALFAGMACALDRHHMGTFMQCSFHGNLGYIGLAVCYYLLGEKGLTSASILAGFLMMCQNLLSVFRLPVVFRRDGKRAQALVFHQENMRESCYIVGACGHGLFTAENPCSRDNRPGPQYHKRDGPALGPLSHRGVTLFRSYKSKYQAGPCDGPVETRGPSGPGHPRILPRRHSIRPVSPGLILLSAPSATISYVMAGEMNGSTDLASAAISMNTLLSALTFILWLWQFN